MLEEITAAYLMDLLIRKYLTIHPLSTVRARWLVSVTIATSLLARYAIGARRSGWTFDEPGWQPVAVGDDDRSSSSHRTLFTLHTLQQISIRAVTFDVFERWKFSRMAAALRRKLRSLVLSSLDRRHSVEFIPK